MGLFSKIRNWISDRIPRPQPTPAPDRPRRSWRDWLPWNRRKKEEPEEKPDEPAPGPQDNNWKDGVSGGDIPDKRKEPLPPLPPVPPVPPKDKPDDITVVIDANESLSIQPPEPTVPQQDVTTLTDDELITKYDDMISKMIQQGYIDEFRNDKEKAEFLRVLSSNAWNEAHTYFYSIVAFQEIQDAIQRGATARALQEQYNMEKEKKSNAFLQLWDTWAYYDR